MLKEKCQLLYGESRSPWFGTTLMPQNVTKHHSPSAIIMDHVYLNHQPFIHQPFPH